MLRAKKASARSRTHLARGAQNCRQRSPATKLRMVDGHHPAWRGTILTWVLGSTCSFGA